MKNKMIETKCKTCLGCNRLLDPNFKEVYRCNNYIGYYKSTKKVQKKQSF